MIRSFYDNNYNYISSPCACSIEKEINGCTGDNYIRIIQALKKILIILCGSLQANSSKGVYKVKLLNELHSLHIEYKNNKDSQAKKDRYNKVKQKSQA